MYGYIYKITNLINGKIYIGKHKGEFDPSYQGSGTILKEAKEKYGWENFKVEVLAECDTLVDLNRSEEYFIDKYNCRDREIGYNIAKGGDGGDTWSSLTPKRQEQVRQKRLTTRANWSDAKRAEVGEKLSRANIGRPQSEETRKKKSETLKGHEVSQETRNKISDTKLNFYQTEEGLECKQRISDSLKGNTAWNKGKKMSDEYCQSVKDSHPVGYFHHTDEAKARISKAMTGREISEETCNRLRIANGTAIMNVETELKFHSINAAAKYYHVAPRNISACVNGLRELAGGFHWIFIDKSENNL